MRESTYEDERERLDQALCQLQGFADSREAGDLAEALRGLGKKLAEQRLSVVVLGEFKRGKSTFVNALVGAPVLPTGVVPLTSVVTVLTWGDQPGARIAFADGREKEVSVDELPAFVTERGNPQNGLGAARATVSYPASDLRNGIWLVDTPGTGSAFVHNTETALSFLPETDAAIFLLSVDTPVSEAELELHARIRAHAARTFYVVNKVDHVEPSDLDEITTFVGDLLRRQVGREVTLHAVSAREALEAQTQQDAHRLEASGLPAFVRVLHRFLLDERGVALLSSVAGAAMRIVAAELTALDVERRALEWSVEEAEHLSYRIDQVAMRARTALGDLSPLLRSDCDQITATMQTNVRSFGALERTRLRAVLEEAVSSIDPRREAASVVSRIEEGLGADIGEWLGREAAKIGRSFREATDRYVEEAERISEESASLFGDSLGVEVDLPMNGVALDSGRRFTLSLFEAPTILGSILPNVRRLLSRRAAERRLRSELEGRIDDLVDKHQGRLRSHLADRIEAGRRTFESSLEASQEASLAGLRRGLDRARAEREWSERAPRRPDRGFSPRGRSSSRSGRRSPRCGSE